MELEIVGGGCEKGCMDQTQTGSHLVTQEIQVLIRKMVEHLLSDRKNCCDCGYAAQEAVQQECGWCLGNVPVVVGEVDLTLMIYSGRTRKFERKSCCQRIVTLSLGMVEGKPQVLENDNWLIGKVLNLVAGSLNPSHQLEKTVFPLQAKLVGTFPSYSG